MLVLTNAVNLTDGLDGLAASVTLAVMAFFAFAAHYLAGVAPENGEMQAFAMCPRRLAAHLALFAL